MPPQVMAALTTATDNVMEPAPSPGGKLASDAAPAMAPSPSMKRASEGPATAPSPAKRPSLGQAPAAKQPATPGAAPATPFNDGPLLKFTPEDQSLLVELCQKPFERQAKHFINAFWDRKTKNKPFGEIQEECERIWQWAQEFAKLDKASRGNELDEFEAHQFLEKSVGALTVTDMRTSLKAIDIDFNRMMSLTDFLIFHYALQESDWVYLVNWAPGMSVAQRRLIEAAQAQMARARASLTESRAAAEHAKLVGATAAKEQETASTEAQASEKAAAESASATEAMEAQETALADELVTQEAMACDDSLSVVKRSRAKAQVAILKNADSQTLRTARITSGAAARKMKKAAKVSQQAADVAEKAKLAAEQAQRIAADAVAAADLAVKQTTNQLEEAKAACAEGGCEDGTFWWLDREFEESMKYMGPKQKVKALDARTASRRKSGTYSPQRP